MAEYSGFQVSDKILGKYTKELPLLVNTETLDSQEKQYWLDLLPHMSDDHINRLFIILSHEKQKLAEVEKKYQEEVRLANEETLREIGLCSGE